jgi:hypothetical protein
MRGIDIDVELVDWLSRLSVVDSVTSESFVSIGNVEIFLGRITAWASSLKRTRRYDPLLSCSLTIKASNLRAGISTGFPENALIRLRESNVVMDSPSWISFATRRTDGSENKKPALLNTCSESIGIVDAELVVSTEGAGLASMRASEDEVRGDPTATGFADSSSV